MPCVIFDNLNACFDGTQKGPSKWCGLRADKEWLAIRDLMKLMLQFRSRIYVCTATAEHWKIGGTDGAKYNQESANVRDWARQCGIASWTGKEFWDDLSSYRL
eukprot:5532182-Heterocapsa_arctica.AAC.1